LTVVRTIQGFIETDSMKDHLRSGRPTSASNDDKSATILQSFIEIPNTYTKKVATENSQSSVCNIFKKHRFHSYRMLYVQELVHEDFEKNRIEFCELIEARGNDFINNIIFSDEVSNMGMLIIRISDIRGPKIHIGWKITNFNILIKSMSGQE